MDPDPFARLTAYYDALGQVALTQAQWQDDDHTWDYACADTQRMVMEKARYSDRDLQLSGVKVRFWLKEHASIVDKFFAADLEPVGWFAVVCTGFDAAHAPLRTETRFVGIGINPQRRIVVTGESRLQQALARQAVTPAEAAQLQAQLRQLRIDCMANRYPPAIVRNFALAA